MKKTRSKILCALAALLGVFFVFACVAGFAACGDGEPETYRFEAEDAKLDGDESEMLYWLDNEVYQGSYITGFGFIFDIQEDETASGGESVGYLAHNNPTATFTINSKKAVSGATLTLRAASCDVDATGISSVYGLMVAGINSYSGADHNILSVNGQSVALSGTLTGSDSVFSTDGLAMSNWGTLTATIDLVKGDNTIVLTHDGAGVNWDYIEIESTAALSMTATDNSNFTVDKDTYVPGEGGDDTQGGGPGSIVGENTLSIEAEDAYLMNAVGSTSLMNAEAGDDQTHVANFKTAGDMIVFQVNASAATEVSVAINANYSKVQITSVSDFDASGHSIFYVNGTDSSNLVTLSGTLDKNHDYGNLTATVSLSKGINYLILTCPSADASSLGFMNVDYLTLSWDGEATIEEVSDYTGEVFAVDATGVATMEAENASLFNSMDSSASSTTIIGTEQTTLTGGVITNVKNFNTTGDKIVFQVNAAAAVSDVTIDVIACNGATFGGTFADNDKILTVNGGGPIALTGTLTNTAFDWSSYGALTGTISLQKGINYIEITAASTASTGYLNVDRIDLNGGTGAAAEPGESETDYSKVTDSTGTYSRVYGSTSGDTEGFFYGKTTSGTSVHFGDSVVTATLGENNTWTLSGTAGMLTADLANAYFLDNDVYSNHTGHSYIAFGVMVGEGETVTMTVGEKTATCDEGTADDACIYTWVLDVTDCAENWSMTVVIADESGNTLCTYTIVLGAITSPQV